MKRLGLVTAFAVGMAALIAASDSTLGRELVGPTDTPHIVPPMLDDGIVVNIPQRMLFLMESGRVVVAFPIAAGRPSWQTPTGAFTVIAKRRNPTWYVPESIQEEMRGEGKTPLTVVPPSPDNPLGAHWIGTSLPGIGIHGTNAPASIGRLTTHGCIRLHPENAADLFDRVTEGTAGRTMYEPVLLARLADGRIFLEVHPDSYQRLRGGAPPLATLLAAEYGLTDLINWETAARVIKQHEGIAREVTAR